MFCHIFVIVSPGVLGSQLSVFLLKIVVLKTIILRCLLSHNEWEAIQMDLLNLALQPIVSGLAGCTTFRLGLCQPVGSQLVYF